MKQLKIISLFILMGVLTASTRIRGAETIAVVLKVKGSVSVTHAGNNSSESVKRGHRLQEGDKLVTGFKSFVAFRFIDDASLIRITANSTCTIQGKKENNQILKNIYVEVGTIFTSITQQKGKFQVATPTSVASVKGTRFITVHTENPGSDYFNEEGLLEIASDAGSVLLMAGFTAHVASKDSLPVVRETVEGEKPTLEEDEKIEDEFELEFEDESGKVRKFE
jgi:hypothetical protein